MHTFPYLRTATDQSVRIDHRPFVDVSADIYIRRRHKYHVFSNIRAIADSRTAGNDPHFVLDRHWSGRKCILIEKPKRTRIVRHLGDHAHSKSKQNPTLYPTICPPDAIRAFLGSTDLALPKSRLEFFKRSSVSVFEFGFFDQLVYG